MRGFWYALVVFALCWLVAPVAAASGDACGCCSGGPASCCTSARSDEGFSTLLAPLAPKASPGCSCDHEPARPEPASSSTQARVQLPQQLLASPHLAADAPFALRAARNPLFPAVLPPPPTVTFLLKCSLVC